MKIYVTRGTGSGKTKIAAFDRALWDAGIADYNLIKLSSMIPEGSDVVVEKPSLKKDEHGHRLYIVLSESYEDVPGKKAIAGLGWVTANRTKGKGIFIENADGNDRKKITEYINETVKSMLSYRPEEHGPVRIEFSEAVCRGEIACALVAAVYKSEGWK